MGRTCEYDDDDEEEEEEEEEEEREEEERKVFVPGSLYICLIAIVNMPMYVFAASFEVRVNDVLVFSKLECHAFPQHKKVCALSFFRV
jgi:hypothetical protein